jgi:tetratricopeptide (TPR) repeat protein
MRDWLRLLSMIFYAPARAMQEVRDRASLAPAAVLAVLVHSVFFFYVAAPLITFFFNPRRPFAFIFVSFQAAGSLIFIALVFVPVAIFLANLYEHRGSLRLVIQQEYSAVTATTFYAWAAASLIALLLTIAGRLSGVQQALGRRVFEEIQRQPNRYLESLPFADPRILNPTTLAIGVSFLALILVFAPWAILAIRTVFRLSWARSTVVVIVSGMILLPASYVLLPIFSTLLASPFLLLILFLLLRGYIGEVTRTQRARVAFKQNLEAATLNPADASAHYNLGLIHQQRGELEAARERFERAVQIDNDEIDAHYQLGRIARQQKRLADAIRNFEHVVARDPSHSQYEIWREVGATYIAAGQFEDARTALERFLDHRESDPEGLYLMGRAHAGLGHRREAASLMEACINAVKTAPAYKYRMEKRWLNEAQQFLRSQV